MKLLPKTIERTIPSLYATEGQEEKKAYVKFYTPDAGFTWYGMEYDPAERLFFGLVKGHFTEYGYFSLDELESVRGPLGLPIERDLYFTPVPVSSLMEA